MASLSDERSEGSRKFIIYLGESLWQIRDKEFETELRAIPHWNRSVNRWCLPTVTRCRMYGGFYKYGKARGLADALAVSVPLLHEFQNLKFWNSNTFVDRTFSTHPHLSISRLCFISLHCQISTHPNNLVNT